MKVAKTLLLVASLPFTCCVSEAAVLHVPDEYTSIQGALDAAATGDTVLIACGTYYEHGLIDTSGVTLASETGLADCVTIDGLNLGTVLTCDLVDGTTTIEGLTIRNGLSQASEPGMELGGGGITCRISTVGIYGCVFIDNSSPHLSGGAISANPLPLHVESCVFIGNSTEEGNGGAIISQVGATQIVDCRFEGNVARRGGAVAAYLCEATVEGCTFVGNTAQGNHGGAIDLYDCDAIVTRCTFTGNSAADFGGGILCGSGSDAAISNCTFDGNTAEHGAGVVAGWNCDPTIENSIIAFSTAGGAVYCHDYAPTSITLTCCDLYGNVGGDWVDCGSGQQGIAGNVSLDPLFCGDAMPDSPYTLDSGSPCAAANSQGCGLIGAFDVGCATPVEAASWTVIKSLYRECRRLSN